MQHYKYQLYTFTQHEQDNTVILVNTFKFTFTLALHNTNQTIQQFDWQRRSSNMQESIVQKMQHSFKRSIRVNKSIQSA